MKRSAMEREEGIPSSSNALSNGNVERERESLPGPQSMVQSSFNNNFHHGNNGERDEWENFRYSSSPQSFVNKSNGVGHSFGQNNSHVPPPSFHFTGNHDVPPLNSFKIDSRMRSHIPPPSSFPEGIPSIKLEEEREREYVPPPRMHQAPPPPSSHLRSGPIDQDFNPYSAHSFTGYTSPYQSRDPYFRENREGGYYNHHSHPPSYSLPPPPNNNQYSSAYQISSFPPSFPPIKYELPSLHSQVPLHPSSHYNYQSPVNKIKSEFPMPVSNSNVPIPSRLPMQKAPMPAAPMSASRMQSAREEEERRLKHPLRDLLPLFELEKEPRGIQRRCYQNETRYVRPNPRIRLRPQFINNPQVALTGGQVKVYLVDSEERPITPEHTLLEPQSGGGDVALLQPPLWDSDKFKLKIYQYTHGTKYKLKFVVDYLLRDLGEFQEVIYSDVFIVQSNKKKKLDGPSS